MADLKTLLAKKAALEASIRSARASMSGELRIADAHVKKALGGAVPALAKDAETSPEVRAILGLIVCEAGAGVKSAAGRMIYDRLRSSLPPI